MKTKLINIGNSKGIRIPKGIIEKYQFGEKLNVVETKEGILIKAADEPRAGWEKQFKKSVPQEQADLNAFNEVSNEFDEEEWTW